MAEQTSVASARVSPRFEFGRNWTKFLDELDDSRIHAAVCELSRMLDVGELRGKRFLDVGCGSGLSSLAAKKLGATVLSFDLDPLSVQCTKALKEKYFPGDDGWKIEQASALDDDYFKGIGEYDVVYSWGVLHHTGNLWQALSLIEQSVAANGKLYLALYNDQGRVSKLWLRVKQLYVHTPALLRWSIVLPCFAVLWGPAMLRDLLVGRPLQTWRQYGKNRGMSAMRDLIDWVGGYPFEVCKPERVFDFYHSRSYRLIALKTCGGAQGCNEFLFERTTCAE